MELITAIVSLAILVFVLVTLNSIRNEVKTLRQVEQQRLVLDILGTKKINYKYVQMLASVGAIDETQQKLLANNLEKRDA